VVFGDMRDEINFLITSDLLLERQRKRWIEIEKQEEWVWQLVMVCLEEDTEVAA
jgi:hypothetical protein